MKPFTKLLYIYISVSAVLVLSALIILLWCINTPQIDPISEQERKEKAEAGEKEKNESRKRHETHMRLIENQVKSELPLVKKKVEEINKKHNYENHFIGYRKANKNNALLENIPFFGMSGKDGFFAISLKGDTLNKFHKDFVMSYETFKTHYLVDKEGNFYYFKEYIDETDTDFKLFNR